MNITWATYNRMETLGWGVAGPKNMITPGRTVPVKTRAGKIRYETIHEVVKLDGFWAYASIKSTYEKQRERAANNEEQQY